MAKKRVHEIAKERGISSKEVIAVLQKAGLDVKASASSVDENDIAMAFSNGKKKVEPHPRRSRRPAGEPAPRHRRDARQPPRAQQPAATIDPAAPCGSPVAATGPSGPPAARPPAPARAAAAGAS